MSGNFGVLEQVGPLVGDRSEGGVEAMAQVVDDRRERVAEILILAAAEAVLLHVDAGAEAVGIGVERDELVTLRRCEERG